MSEQITKSQVEKWMKNKREELGITTLELSVCDYSEPSYTAHMQGACTANSPLEDIEEWVHSRSPEAEANENLEWAKLRLEAAQADVDKLRGKN